MMSSVAVAVVADWVVVELATPPMWRNTCMFFAC